MEILRLFLRLHSVRKLVLASRNVDCFLRLYRVWQAQKSGGAREGKNEREKKEGALAKHQVIGVY